MKQYYFISGLPRSGSTLLSAILKQNPEFYADISSPVQSLVQTSIDVITSSENNLVIQEDRRKTLIQHIFEGYYNHIDNPVVFDSNRGWTSTTSLLKNLFPYTKILCCVRDIEWILDSFERITAKNCFYTNTFADEETIQSVETRCMGMMDVKKSGMIIKPWHWLQEGLAINPDMIMLVEYKDLCQNPKKHCKGYTTLSVKNTTITILTMLSMKMSYLTDQSTRKTYTLSRKRLSGLKESSYYLSMSEPGTLE